MAKIKVGTGPTGLLGVVFVTLKLLGKIDWSWAWVLAPFWIPLVLVVVFLCFALLMAVLAGQTPFRRA